jgi:hypothetical protein
LSLNSVFDLTFTLNKASKNAPLIVETGPSGDIYFMSDVSLDWVEDQRTYIARLRDDNTAVWEKVYQYRASSTEFNVDPDEKYVRSQFSSFSHINLFRSTLLRVHSQQAYYNLMQPTGTC